MNLSPSFVGGTQRAAFLSREIALAAASAAFQQDEKRRPRAVWWVRGAQHAGVVVPDRWVVGLADTKSPPTDTPRESWVVVGKESQA